MTNIKPYISFAKSNTDLYDGKLLRLSDAKEILKRYSKRQVTKQQLTDYIYPIFGPKDLYCPQDLINTNGYFGVYMFLRETEYSENPTHTIGGFNFHHAVQYVGSGDIETVVSHSCYKDKRSDGKLYDYLTNEIKEGRNPWVIFFTIGFKKHWADEVEADVIRVIMDQQDREGPLCNPYYKKYGSFLLNKRRVKSIEYSVLDYYGNVKYRPINGTEIK